MHITGTEPSSARPAGAWRALTRALRRHTSSAGERECRALLDEAADVLDQAEQDEAAAARALARELVEFGVEARGLDAARAWRGTLWLEVAGLRVRLVCADQGDAGQVAAAHRLCGVTLVKVFPGDTDAGSTSDDTDSAFGGDGADRGAPTFVLAGGQWTFYVTARSVAVESTLH